MVQASRIHPRALTAGRKVKLRQGEQKGSLLTFPPYLGRKFPLEVLSRFSLPLCWLEVGQFIFAKPIITEKEVTIAVPLGQGCLYLSTNLNEY